MPRVTLRAYASLTDFLAPGARGRASAYDVERRVSVKDLVERAGIPHVEIDLLLVNGEPAAFDRLLQEGDRIAVFPRFFSIDVGGVSRVRPPGPAAPRFVLDVHLGRLARRLRLAGLDAAYPHDAADAALAATSAGEERILLTRDVGLLKRRLVTYGYFVRATDPDAQFVEVLRRFAPLPLAPFSRCLRCNGVLRPVDKAEIRSALPPRTRAHYDEFWRCDRCSRLFWKGAHFERLARALDRASREAAGSPPAADQAGQ